MRAFLRRTEGSLLCLTPRWVCACVRKDGRGTMGELCPVVFQISSVVPSLDDFEASLWEAFLSLLENPKIRRINCNQETTDLEVTTWTQDFMSPKFAVVAHGNRSACGDSWRQCLRLWKTAGKVQVPLGGWLLSHAPRATPTLTVSHTFEKRRATIPDSLWEVVIWRVRIYGHCPDFIWPCVTWQASGLRNTVGLGTNRAII